MSGTKRTSEGGSAPSFCSTCGTKATGKFCTHCGTPLRGATCRHCGAQLSPGARFCQNCSQRVGGAPQARDRLPWIIASAAAVIVVIVLAVGLGPGFARPQSQTDQVAPPPATPPSPRQEADAIFGQAMTAYELGDSATAAFYGPLALQAYAQLGSLDADARLHVGLLHLIGGNLDGTLAQADSIELGSPTHLFVPVLRIRVYRARGDAAREREALAMFESRYESEVATERIEYQAHSGMLQRLAEEARQGGQ